MTLLSTLRFADADRRGRAALPWLYVVFGGVFAVAAYLVVVPIALLVIASLTASGTKLPFESGVVSLHNYVVTLGSGATYAAIANSAVFAAGSTAIGMAIAILFGWLIERTDIACRRILFAVILIPMAIPNMIYATAWLQLVDVNNGLINMTLVRLGLPNPGFGLLSVGGMIFVQGIALASHAYLLIAAAFRSFDPTLEEQSAVSGRGTFSTAMGITLPVLRPALLSSIMFFALVCVETFDIPGMLGLSSGIHLLSTQIYWTTHPEGGQLPDYGTASALSFIMLAIALVFIMFYQRQVRRAQRFVTVTGRGFRPRRLPLGRWRLTMLALACFILFVMVVLPLSMLVWRSLLPFYSYPSAAAFGRLSFKAYAELFADADIPRAVTNTIIMAVATAAATMVLSGAIAWLSVRAPVRPSWRGWLRFVALLPQAVPSVVLGFAFLVVYLTLPVPIYGTIWIIALALTTKYMAYGSGVLIAAQLQLSGELEEASLISGAGRLGTYVRIVLPLLAPAVANAGLWVLIHAVRELAIAIMLYSPSSQVLSTEVWSLWEGGMMGTLCALGVLTTIVLLMLLSLPLLVRRGMTMMRAMRGGLPAAALSPDPI